MRPATIQNSTGQEIGMLYYINAGKPHRHAGNRGGVQVTARLILHRNNTRDYREVIASLLQDQGWEISGNEVGITITICEETCRTRQAMFLWIQRTIHAHISFYMDAKTRAFAPFAS